MYDGSNFFESVFALPLPFNMVVLIVLIGSIAGVITTIAKEVRTFLCHRSELELRREMLERGVDAREIDRVMSAPLSQTTKPPVVQKPVP